MCHHRYTDSRRGGTTDYVVRNECLTRDFRRENTVDVCIVKCAALPRLLSSADAAP